MGIVLIFSFWTKIRTSEKLNPRLIRTQSQPHKTPTHSLPLRHPFWTPPTLLPSGGTNGSVLEVCHCYDRQRADGQLDWFAISLAISGLGPAHFLSNTHHTLTHTTLSFPSQHSKNILILYYSTPFHLLVWHGVARSGLVWPGVAWYCLVWPGVA